MANINPLHVLYAGVLMRPLSQFSRTQDQISLDNGWILQLDASEQLISLGLNGADHAPQTVDYDTWMQDVVEVAQQTDQPVLVTQAGKVVGAISHKDILHSLLRQTSTSSDHPM